MPLRAKYVKFRYILSRCVLLYVPKFVDTPRKVNPIILNRGGCNEQGTRQSTARYRSDCHQCTASVSSSSSSSRNRIRNRLSQFE